MRGEYKKILRQIIKSHISDTIKTKQIFLDLEHQFGIDRQGKIKAIDKRITVLKQLLKDFE